jgi:hypothetical protein
MKDARLSILVNLSLLPYTMPFREHIWLRGEEYKPPLL